MINASIMTGGTINGTEINGVEINGVQINSGNINVDTDIKVGDSIEIGNPANATGKSIKFGTGASITTKPATLGPSIVFEASEVELPSVICNNLHIDGNLSGVDYATSGHTHGNTYVKSKWGQNLSLAYEESTNRLCLRYNDSIVGYVTLE